MTFSTTDWDLSQHCIQNLSYRRVVVSVRNETVRRYASARKNGALGGQCGQIEYFSIVPHEEKILDSIVSPQQHKNH